MVNDLLVSVNVDVEEIELSDSDSVEEISADVFAAKSPAVTNSTVEESNRQQQVWTMQDLVKYQNKYKMSRNYAPGLYNFAWAQAVQNKPLDAYLTTVSTGATTDNDLKQLNDEIVVDISGDDGDGEEEGELEEGEIDLDTEAVVDVGKEGEDGNVEKWIDVIRVGLEGITLNDANKSFSGVCSRLANMLDSLSTLLSENSVSNKDDLVQLAFSAIQLVNSVFCSMNQNQKELSRHIISRMLTNVKSHVSVMFSPELLKEVENMFLSCNSNDVNQELASDQNSTQSECLKIQTSASKNRVLFPLLDLHKDHDIDSLPSPTRETKTILPLVVGAEIRPEWPTPTPHVVPQCYETDALKAVSSYQQRFSQSSFLSNDLPSPTPSEEIDDANGDCEGEVSSFSNVPEMLNVELQESARNVACVYSTSSSVTRVPNKIRDPRLPLSSKQPIIKPVDALQPARKQKTFDGSVLVDGPAPKRLKIELSDSGTGNVRIPVTGTNATSASLQSVLKDIVVNPTQWMSLMSVEQQMSVDSGNHVTQTSQTSVLDSVPMTTGAAHSLVVRKRSTDETQISHTSSTVDHEKSRMKPRDPRRALQNNMGRSKQADPRVSSQPILPPDITGQLAKKLKNVADVSTTGSASVQISSQPPQVHPSVVNIKGPSNNVCGDVDQLFGRFDDQQRAAIQRERLKRMEEQKQMFADRKLCLVLDLDHTLLNSAKFSEIEPVHDELLKKKEEQDRDKPHRHLFRFPHMGMWTKLRPGVWNFLEKASQLYELHLYTMGNKVYATEMAKVLDPKGVLFKGRVISKGGHGDYADVDPKSKDLEGVLGMESAVIVIDDSLRVWPHNKLNLIVVERYIYFPSSRRQFGLAGPSLLEIDHDERPEHGSLASSLAVIEKIHQLFFMEKSLDEADARNILASEQRKILGGCRILFSRVFPVGEASPHLHPLWQTAEQFGAICTNQIGEQVTHVVANSLGTDKVNWALATGRPVVHPGWVEASALLYRRANEHDFVVKP